jgi:hypothetical protein
MLLCPVASTPWVLLLHVDNFNSQGFNGLFAAHTFVTERRSSKRSREYGFDATNRTLKKKKSENSCGKNYDGRRKR